MIVRKNRAPSVTTPATEGALLRPATASRVRAHAKKAAVEKSQARYFILSCGHYCPAEVKVLYDVFQKIDAMCEQCGDFKPVTGMPFTETYPEDELPF